MGHPHPPLFQPPTQKSSSKTTNVFICQGTKPSRFWILNNSKKQQKTHGWTQLWTTSKSIPQPVYKSQEIPWCHTRFGTGCPFLQPSEQNPFWFYPKHIKRALFLSQTLGAPGMLRLWCMSCDLTLHETIGTAVQLGMSTCCNTPWVEKHPLKTRLWCFVFFFQHS